MDGEQVMKRRRKGSGEVGGREGAKEGIGGVRSE